MARPPFRRRIAALLSTGLLMAGLAVTVNPVRAGAFGFVFQVNTIADTVDVNTADPACKDAAGKCSLRAAVIQANFINPGSGNHHLIKVPAGKYTLSRGSNGEYDALEGDLNIYRSTTIEGAGSGSTFIQGSTTTAVDADDRLFDVRGGDIAVVIKGVTLRRGFQNDGSAITVYPDTSALTLDHVTIRDNLSLNDGPIHADGNLTILDSVVRDNTSGGPTIEHNHGNLTIKRTTIKDNGMSGGAIHHSSGGSIGLIERSTISGNHTSGCCDGLALTLGSNSSETTPLTIRNSTIAGNTGAGNATIQAREATRLTIESTTIAGNTGIGIWPSADTTLRNTILAGSSGGNCDDPLPESLGHNLDTGTTCGLDGPGDIENGKPKLSSLGDYGGPTFTRALGTDSDAIDAGLSCPDFDQRGVTRPKDGDGDGAKRCDIGAYEAATLILPAPTPTAAPPTAAPPTEAPPTGAPPTGAATVAPSEAPASVAPTGVPGESPATSVEPAASEGSIGPTPAPTAVPTPTGSEGDELPILWIVIAVMALVIGVLVGLVARRRGAAPPGGEPAA